LFIAVADSGLQWFIWMMKINYALFGQTPVEDGNTKKDVFNPVIEVAGSVTLLLKIHWKVRELH